MTSGTTTVSGRKGRPRFGGAWEGVAGTPLCKTARMSCKVDCMELTLFSSCSIRLHLGKDLVSRYLERAVESLLAHPFDALRPRYESFLDPEDDRSSSRARDGSCVSSFFFARAFNLLCVG